MKTHHIIELIQDIFRKKGSLNYGEDVTQQEHAIQCYQLAVESGSTVEMRVAAFLHDIGHLFYQESEVNATQDMQHEVLAVELLRDWGFPITITDLIGAHVWAKRYLVSTEEGYLENLSKASQESFVKQGGYLSEDEIAHYQTFSNLNDYLLLRKWDDTGKQMGLPLTIPPSVWEDIFQVLA